MNRNSGNLVILKKFLISETERFDEISIINSSIHDNVVRQILGLVENEIMETEVDDQHSTELWETLNGFQRLCGSEIKDRSATPPVTHCIDIDDSAPIKQKPYRLSYSLKQEVIK